MLQIGIERLSLVELDAERVEDHRDLGVLAGGENHVHALLFVETVPQRGPCCVADDVVQLLLVI